MNRTYSETDPKINSTAQIWLHRGILPIIDKLQETKFPFNHIHLKKDPNLLFFLAGRNIFKVNSHVKVEANKY